MVEKVKEKLNKYELVDIFNARALEIADGAKPKIDVEKEGLKMRNTSDYVEIAKRELELGLLDLELYRD